MKFEIKDAQLTPGSARGRSGVRIEPKGIVIHYAGSAGSGAMTRRNLLESGGGGSRASAHYIVGHLGEILGLIPEGERAAHAGKSFGARWADMARTNNTRLLGIEVCHTDTSGKFSAAANKSLALLCADICIRRNFDPFDQIFRHYDVSGKQCPLFHVRNQGEWNKLRNAVYAGILAKKCIGMNLQIDLPYWERVISGEILANYDYLCILEERVANALKNSL